LLQQLSLTQADTGIIREQAELPLLRDLAGTAKGRFPAYRASAMNWHTDDVSGNVLEIISGQIKSITAASTLYSRYTYLEDAHEQLDEHYFMDRVAEHCKLSGFTPHKLLCGRQHTVGTEQGPRRTRSVLLAEVPPAASIQLQNNGLGNGRTFGCGVLFPHKDTAAVHESV